MSDPITDWSVFPTANHARKVRDGVFEILNGDETMQEFLADEADGTRLYTLPLTALPDKPKPYGYVIIADDHRTPALNRLADTEAKIAIGLVFDENREVLANGDDGYDAWANHVIGLLFGNALIEGTTQDSGAALVTRLESIDNLTPQPLASDGDVVTAVKEIVVTYTYQLDAVSGVLV